MPHILAPPPRPGPTALLRSPWAWRRPPQGWATRVRAWRLEWLGLLLALLLLGLYSGVLLVAMEDARRQHTAGLMARQARMACEGLPRAGERQACVVASATR